jgi:hypothetical protein
LPAPSNHIAIAELLPYLRWRSVWGWHWPWGWDLEIMILTDITRRCKIVKKFTNIAIHVFFFLKKLKKNETNQPPEKDNEMREGIRNKTMK